MERQKTVFLQMLHCCYSFLTQVPFSTVHNCIKVAQKETNCASQIQILPLTTESKHATSCSTPGTGFHHLLNIFLVCCQFCIFKMPRKHYNPHYNDSNIPYKHINNIQVLTPAFYLGQGAAKKRVHGVT